MVINPVGLEHKIDSALMKSSSSCKRQTRPLVREGSPTLNFLTVIKIWSWIIDCGMTPRQIDRLTVGDNVALILSQFIQWRM
jgi:hypothetical protein